jgi:hypothetical protein
MNMKADLEILKHDELAKQLQTGMALWVTDIYTLGASRS